MAPMMGDFGGPMGGPGGHGPKGGFGAGPKEHHKHRRERSLEEISVTVWLTPQNATFERKNGLLHLTYDGKDQRVSLRRIFPFELLWEYVSVQSEEEEEIGIIRTLDLFEGETKALLASELERRYYAPKITAICSMKERYGFSYWRVQTAEGEMKFTLHDTYKSLIRIGADRVILLDVDGNRFEIPSVQALDRKSFRKIELYL